jgi:hypothetical protein
MTKAIMDRPLLAVGRKPKEPPNECAALIEQLAADGWSQLGIAKRLGTSNDTLRRWLDENPELQDAFNSGRENERWQLHNCLYRAAMEKGNIVAAMFLLKARHSYVEGDRAQIVNKALVNVNADMLAQLAKLLPN